METQNVKEQIKSKIQGANPYRQEGKLATAIETQTSRLPSDLFLFAAGGLMVASLTLKLIRKDENALFFGQWVAPILLMGLYNKIVKTQGHDQLNSTPD